MGDDLPEDDDELIEGALGDNPRFTA